MKMKTFRFKHTLRKCLLNYRVVLAYLMATTYLFMNYFVSFTEFHVQQKNDVPAPSSVVVQRLVNVNFNSKKLLNFDKNYEIPKNNQMKRRRVVKSNRHKLIVNQLSIEAPPSLKQELNLKNKTTQFYSQIYQDRMLLHLLDTPELNARNASEQGLFVEAGAYDGETWSNTLYLERSKNWTGLLIEPSVESYKLLKSKHRQAYSVNSCLGGGRRASRSTFIEAGPFGITTNSSSSSSETDSQIVYAVTCHPLDVILDQFFQSFPQFKTKKSRISPQWPMAVDYLSLDIEGNERSIVQSFDWNKYRFNLINIEFNQNRELYEWLKSHLRKYGYVETLQDDVWYQDLYLAHESVFPLLNTSFTKVSQFTKAD